MNLKQNRVLFLMWNPGDSAVTAGGFVRTIEVLRILKKLPLSAVIIDSAPSIMAGLQGGSIRLFTYHIPKAIRKLAEKTLFLERIIEWNIAFWALLWGGVKLRNEYDIIFVPFSEMLVVSIPAAILKIIVRKPLVFCNMNTDGNSVERALNNWAHRSADRIFSVSEQLAHDLVKDGKPDRIFVSYVGIDLTKINSTPKQAEKFDALFVGRHVKTKGIFDYIEVLSEVVKHKPNFRFASIGACSPEIKSQLIHQLKKRGLRKNWHFFDIVKEEDKYKIIKQTKVMWFLSSLEGWGIVPQEALGCGVPVLNYDLPVYKEHIKKCKAAYFVPINDWRAAATKAIELDKMDTKERKALGKVGQEFVKQYDWERVAKRDYDIITGQTNKRVEQ